MIHLPASHGFMQRFVPVMKAQGITDVKVSRHPENTHWDIDLFVPPTGTYAVLAPCIHINFQAEFDAQVLCSTYGIPTSGIHHDEFMYRYYMGLVDKVRDILTKLVV